MSILSIINEKKKQFRVNQAHKLSFEKERLKKEVSEQRAISRDKQEIASLKKERNEMRFAPLKNLGNKINSNLSSHEKYADKNKSQGSIFTQKSNIDPFRIGSGSNPYDFTGKKDIIRRTPKKKTITIRYN